jgi:ATP-dependent Clp protease ATP-binding subunit ClpA
MWQRFTEHARKAVFYGQEEAHRLDDSYVSTEHLLLGVVRESDNAAAQALVRMGVSLGRVRSEIERQLVRGEGWSFQNAQLTRGAKRVVDFAYQEAGLLKNNYIGTEHLLLGLILERDGLAGRVLADLGVEIGRARQEVIYVKDGVQENAIVWPPPPQANPPQGPWEAEAQPGHPVEQPDGGASRSKSLTLERLKARGGAIGVIASVMLFFTKAGGR